MANAIVKLPTGYFPDPDRGRPLFNAKIYIGEPDLDPRIDDNQKTVTGRQEDGTEVALEQPIRTNSGGVPIDGSDNVVSLLVDGAYSMAVDDRQDNQKYYFDNVLQGAPVTFDVLGLYSAYPFNTAEDAKSGLLSDGLTTVDLEIGDLVVTYGRLSKGDGGDAKYSVVAGGTGTSDGGLYIDLDNGNQLQLIYTAPLNVKWFGAVDAGDASTPFSTSAIQAAVDTGLNVFFPAGTYLLDDEILINTSGQSLIGETLGARLGNEKDLSNVQTQLKVPIGTTIPRYTKTRRNARSSAVDPVDDPISCMINIEGTGVTIRGIAGNNDCDYTDFSPSNLGADCDVFIFNGCRGATTIEDCPWIGYFRVAGILLDSTRGTNLPEFQTPGGVTYSSDGTNGGDQVRIIRCQGTGGLKQVYLRGPVLNGAGTYYDDSTGLVSDTRGGSGNSDLSFQGNCVFEGRDHHSGYRAYDFIGDPDADDIEAISCGIMIDAVRGSSSQGRTRRIDVQNMRLRSIEGARMFVGRGYEVYINWMHTEPLDGFSGSVFTTQGVLISDPSDTENETYGPLACQSTSGTDEGADQIRADGVWGTGLVGAWTRDLVDNFTGTRDSVNPLFSVTLNSDLIVGDDLTVADQITGANLNLTTEKTSWTPAFLFATATYIQQVGIYTQIADMVFLDFIIEYNTLDTGDENPITISGLPDIQDNESSITGQLNLFTSTGITPTNGAIIGDNEFITQFVIKDINGTDLTYNGGEISASGILQGRITYRVS